VTVNSRVSIVDDDPSMCRMLARGIGAAGFEVAIFNSAEEFLESGGPLDSTCLILDVDLPGMSGIELQQRLSECGVNLPVIFISAHTDRLAKRTLSTGTAGFFNKPFKIDDLIATLQTVEKLNPVLR
jgi:FixJ family two-component response regulator